MSKRLSLCLAGVAITMIFAGCQNTSGSNAATTPYSTEDINTSVPFQGTPATLQQAGNLARTCEGRPSTQSTNSKLRKVSKLQKTHESTKMNGLVSSSYSNYESSACMMGTKENVQRVYYIGTYTLPNGRQISALRQITTKTGLIVCGRRVAGHGHQTTDQIFSVKTMGNQWAGCRQSELVSTDIFRLDNGAVVDSSNGR